MNKKGEAATGVGAIIAIAVMIIFGMALVVPIAQNQGTLTNLGQTTNSSYTLPANGTTQDLNVCGQRNTTAVTINNYTNSAGVAGNGGAGNASLAGNFTITQAQGNSGYLQTRVAWSSLGAAYVQAGYLTNVTCQFEPMGYNTDASSRGIAGTILIFTAIAMAIVGIRRDWFDFA